MITELSREELIVTGRPLRADYLAEQAGYTLGVAALDGKGVEALLPPTASLRRCSGRWTR